MIKKIRNGKTFLESCWNRNDNDNGKFPKYNSKYCRTSFKYPIRCIETFLIINSMRIRHLNQVSTKNIKIYH